MPNSPATHDNGRGKPLRETAYRSHRWRKASEDYRQLHPQCVKCGAPATLVDHIIPHEGDDGRFWDQYNWRSLCHTCHNRKTFGTVNR